MGLAFAPELLEGPTLYEAIEGRPFSAHCKFFSSPLANVTWDTPPLLGSDYFTKVDQFGTGWLMFERVQPGHEGDYRLPLHQEINNKNLTYSFRGYKFSPKK